MGAAVNAPFARDMDTLAHSILSGRTTLLPAVEYDLYDFGEWHTAAQSFLDDGDPTELQFMVSRERLYDEFRTTTNEDDFAGWLDRKAGWSKAEPYFSAMTNSERRQWARANRRTANV